MAGSKRGQSKRQSFGRLRQERSGRWSAAYLHHGTLHRAADTFPTKSSAVRWLEDERDLIELDRRNLGVWTSPAARLAQEEAARKAVTVAEYAETWIKDKPVARRTRDSYRYLLDTRVKGTALAEMPVTEVTVSDIRTWFGSLDASTPTARARAYEVVSSMFSAAVADGLLPATPCRVVNARKVRRARPVVHIESPEVEELATAMPEHLRAAVLLAAWCGLRFGELIALDRQDVAVDGSSVNVHKGLTRRNMITEVSAPKSETSVRLVSVPPHIRAAVTEHLTNHVKPGQNSPVFTDSGNDRITEGKFRPAWHKAREAIDRPTLRFHDLRHHAGLVAAYAGATIAESMARLGHSSPKMALHYAERAAARDALLADRITALATPSTTPANDGN